MIHLERKLLQKKITREYLARLGTVATLFLTALIVIHGVFLLPTYLFYGVRIQELRDEEMRLDDTLALAEESALEKRLLYIGVQTNFLKTAKNIPVLTDAYREISSVRTEQISITGFTYEPSRGEVQGTMRIQGVAGTREALYQFVRELESRPSINQAAFPIGNLARERDIPFTITAQGTF